MIVNRKKCIYVFERCSDEEKIFVIFNFSDKEQTFEYRTVKTLSFHLLIASDMDVMAVNKPTQHQKYHLTTKKQYSTYRHFRKDTI